MQHQVIQASPPWRDFTRRFLIYAPVLAIIAFAAAIWLDQELHNRQVAQALTREHTKLDATSSRIAQGLAETVADLRVMSQATTLRRYFEGEQRREAEEVVRLFRTFMENLLIYEHARLLGLDGRELIRVDQAGDRAIPAPPEQFAVHTDLAAHILSASPNSVYISPFEFRAVPGRNEETAIQPVLNIATPIFTPDGERRGTLVLDIRGQWIFDIIEFNMSDGLGQVMFLDDNGNWLYNGSGQINPDDEGAQAAGFWQQTWQALSQADRGQYSSPQGIFLYTTIHPRQATLRELRYSVLPEILVSEDRAWKLASFIPAEAIRYAPLDLFRNHPYQIVALVFGVLYVAAILSWARTLATYQARITEASEQQLRDVLDNTQMLAFIKDLEGRYQFVNRRMEELFSAYVGDVLGKTDFDILPAQDAEQVTRNDRQVILSGSPMDVEETLVCQGEKRVYLSARVPLRRMGTLQGICCIATDITERKRMEDALREAAVVFQSAHEGIVIADRERRIIKVNQAYTTITGYHEQELLGTALDTEPSDYHDDQFYRILWKQLEENGSWQGEIWHRRKSGEVFPAWENISLIKDDQGEIVNYVAILSDISPIKEAEERLSYLAHHDALTGLPNRTLFRTSLEQAILEAKRDRTLVGLFFLDLDRFKYVNDTLGHQAGDELLKLVAQKLRDSVRTEDTVSRLGGDEFTIILRGVHHPEDVVGLAEKIIWQINQPMMIQQREVWIGVSIGIAFYPTDAPDALSLSKAADSALYRAKGQGRRTFAFYTPELSKVAEKHLQLERELRQALEREEFQLFFQPYVDVQTEQLAGTDVVLRWRHPARGLLKPEEFIQVAEETRMITDIESWIIKCASHQAMQWLKNQVPFRVLAVNVSTNLLTRENLPQQIQELMASLLKEYETMPPFLEIEISENSLLGRDLAEPMVMKLHEMGIRVSIDDFGTGSFSLASLKELPLHTLKIPRSITEAIPDNHRNANLTATIVSLAHSLGLSVIAKGIDTQGQLQYLKTIGCDYVQGELWGPPMDAETYATAAKCLSLSPQAVESG